MTWLERLGSCQNREALIITLADELSRLEERIAALEERNRDMDEADYHRRMLGD